MAGHETARSTLGTMEAESGNMDRAVKHWSIAALAGHYPAMHTLITFFKMDYVSQESIDLTLAAYNTSCVEMRSEARDAYTVFNVMGTNENENNTISMKDINLCYITKRLLFLP